jgi:serine/threonine protein kinase
MLLFPVEYGILYWNTSTEPSYVLIGERIQNRTNSYLVVVGQITCNIRAYITRYRNTVKGKLKDGRKALIKIYPKYIPIKQLIELDMLLYLSVKARPHPNIIQFLLWEQDKKLTYVAFEHCMGNLMTAVMKGKLEVTNIEEQRNYFRQLTSGISFLHENGIQHCKIRPENILCKTTGAGLSLVISNFKWSHESNLELETLSEVKPTFNKQTQDVISDRFPNGYHMFVNCDGKWDAPEQHYSKQSRSGAEDIFSLGCVFYFMLTRENPFEKISNVLSYSDNITLCNVSLSALHEHFVEEDHLASLTENLIFKMICPIPSSRLKAGMIEIQPCLWTNEDMKNFFRRLGNLMQDNDDPTVVRFKKELEKNASKVFDGNWMDELDPAVKNDLKCFKNMKKEVCGLLRAIRNKIEHFEKIRNPELREIYRSPAGVAEYYMKRFTELVPYTFDILEKNTLALY